ncbi:MAG: peroxiredoxin [Pseudomonadota bacterium]
MKTAIVHVAAFYLLTLAAIAASAESPAVGSPAPDFDLMDQDGLQRSLEDYRGRWVALYFYPKDDTPGCTTEACEFRDDIFKYRRADCAVLGVSLDDTASHKEFAEKYSLPFPLLADTSGETANAYGVLVRRTGASVAKRQTFLIDPHGNIAKHYARVSPEEHSSEILEDLAALQAATE